MTATVAPSSDGSGKTTPLRPSQLWRHQQGLARNGTKMSGLGTRPEVDQVVLDLPDCSYLLVMLLNLTWSCCSNQLNSIVM